MPKSYLSEEKREEILKALPKNIVYSEEARACINVGDTDNCWKWFALIPMPAHSPAYLKETRGGRIYQEI